MWKINGQIEPHTRPGVDASGWLWEIENELGTAKRVLVEVTGTAHAVADSTLPGDTAAAITTEGHSELVKVLHMDDPPRVIGCGTGGCHHLTPEEVRGD